ncbi:enoyl-ACP reductase [Mycolicibacterium sp. CH28]|uniref:saccharopine dehydrogenase family protein n=1 Tax=Mycolicibacterium sp. CH28 TaxID=2512237 RepID=UPI001081AED0|nr:trans-acting enoyl reductase family protein [Mycolicibacterium sp. CH28]TGD90622.1 enoyl-ACP reductase [Mycolicibacterium sp. CH28]
MTAVQREFDIVVYGATGFVGRLTAQYLAQAGGDVRVALAGRSPEKLLAVRETLGEAAQSWPILTADAASPSALADLAARTRVVITTVGPYSRYGLPLVAACAAAGTDYADLTGEAMFVRQSIDDYHKQAIDTGARIVHACGFDSIPSDMSVFALYRRAQQDGAGELGDTNFVLRGFSGGVSGGTVASMIEVFRASSNDPNTRRMLEDPYTLTQDRGAEPELGAQPDLPRRRGSDIAPELAGVWTTGFVMALYNTRIVRRSNALLNYAYGRRFRYAENMAAGSSVIAPLTSALATAANNGAVALGSRFFRFLPRRLVERIAPKPGTGPSEQTRDRGYYRAETYTTTTSGARYLATISQQGDPGYKATSVMLGECGLALALDRDKLTDLHGVLTPAAAMGDALLTRFPAAGIALETVRLG